MVSVKHNKYAYIERFRDYGYGLFVHFGLYSLIGKGEWAQDILEIDKNKYESLKNKFNPKKDWAEKIVAFAQKNGCKYITLTTRHHDGFSLYDTKGLSEYDAMHSAAGRDLVREFVDACRKYDVVPFFYHTLIDWYNEDYVKNFDNYIEYLIKSIEILCTEYGEIGGYWFDGVWDNGTLNWQFDRLYGMIRRLQPNTMIINNTGISNRGAIGHPEIDSVTFERGTPNAVINNGKPIAGEMCQTLNDHWGYTKDDLNYKCPAELIKNLLDCRICNCNLLMNMGPKGNGDINAIDKNLFETVGKFIKSNKEFIYKARPAEDITANGAKLLYDGKYYYAVVFDVPMVANPNVQLLPQDKKYFTLSKPVKNLRWLDNGKQLKKTKLGYYVDTFKYGGSNTARIARFELDEK